MQITKSTVLLVVISCAAPIIARGGTGDVIRSLGKGAWHAFTPYLLTSAPTLPPPSRSHRRSFFG
jgi:hypothetical protein